VDGNSRLLHVLRATALAALLLVLWSCGTHAYHLVQRGDSLYSVSWSYGYDYKDVARWNGLQSPYELTPGQRIRFIPRATGAKVATPPKPAVVETESPATHVPHSPHAAVVEKNTGVITWHWPAEGAVIGRFDANDPLKKGINISGELGQPVRAAASGKVVYSGSGLIGYGKLIILKHNETLLSAYAHNKDLLVSEGEFVEVGKQIAGMGSSGANVVMLHFEIRRDGVPVDPVEFLPGRQLQ
jgi:lipoprotein NlpD